MNEKPVVETLFRVAVEEYASGQDTGRFGPLGSIVNVVNGSVIDLEGFIWCNDGEGFDDIEQLNAYFNKDILEDKRCKFLKIADEGQVQYPLPYVHQRSSEGYRLGAPCLELINAVCLNSKELNCILVSFDEKSNFSGFISIEEETVDAIKNKVKENLQDNKISSMVVIVNCLDNNTLDLFKEIKNSSEQLNKELYDFLYYTGKSLITLYDAFDAE